MLNKTNVKEGDLVCSLSIPTVKIVVVDVLETVLNGMYYNTVKGEFVVKEFPLSTLEKFGN